jgi:hypothetical protein
MVEEPALPDWITRPPVFDRPCENTLKRPNPIAEFQVIWQCDEKMQMVRKDHIATNCNAEFGLRAFTESHERFVDVTIRKMRPASIRAAGYKIKRSAWENNVQPSGYSGEFCYGITVMVTE